VTGLSGLVSGLILLLRDAAASSGIAWADRPWTRIAPLLVLCGHLAAMALQALLESEAPSSVAVAIIALAALSWLYGHARPSLPALATASALLALVIAAIGVWAVTRLPGIDDSPILLLMLWAGWSCAVLFALQRGLRIAAARMKER